MRYETYSESIGLYMESKQLSLIEKFVCLLIMSVNSVYKFSEILSNRLNVPTDK